MQMAAAAAAAGLSLGSCSRSPAASAAEGVVSAQATRGRMRTRPIPSTGEALPVVGCGTWQTFDLPEGQRLPLVETVRTLLEAGGSVIDSSPMYGRAEAAVGEVLGQIAGHDKTFLATKVWTTGRGAGVAQMQQSMQLMGSKTIDLMQVHNLVDVETHLSTLEAWKREGRVRYVGVTHYTPSAHAELEAVLRRHRLDFVQLDYSAVDRAVESRLLPLAAERGVAVIINQPFGGGRLIQRLSARPLPAFAADIGCTSWAQLLLKFLLGHPAVTCVIPGTGTPEHMRDNVRAGMGDWPDPSMRERIAEAASR